MRSLLDRLYYGEVNPAESIVLQGSDFDIVQEEYNDEYRALCEALDEERTNQLEDLIDTRSKLEDLYCCACFKAGVQTGIQLMLEVNANTSSGPCHSVLF